MPAQDPLTYLSQKAVLKYMDVAKRFELLAKCPSIRSTEKMIPLKIDNMEIEPLKVKINGVGFAISVVKRFDGNKFSANGCSFDVDQYGFQDRKVEMTPGDLSIENAQRLTVEEGRQHENQEMYELEQQLDELKEELASQETPQSRYERKLITDLEKNIKITQRQLQPHHLRRDNKQTSFTHYVKVAFILPNGRERIIELMPYQRKAHEVMKYIMNKFFGGRRVPIQVNTLHIRPKFQQCFRLPVNLKLVVKNLRIQENVTNVLQAFRPILDNSCFPLDSIDIGAKLEYVNDPVISATQKIIINGEIENIPLDGLSHKRVHFANISHWKNECFLMYLIRIWERHGREIGTYYSVGNCQKEAAKNFLKSIRSMVPDSKMGELEVIRGTAFHKCIIVPMRNKEAEIIVYSEKVSTNQDGDQWKIKIKVLPK